MAQALAAWLARGGGRARERLLRGDGRPVPDAESDAPAGRGAVLHLVCPLRDVDLRSLRRSPPSISGATPGSKSYNDGADWVRDPDGGLQWRRRSWRAIGLPVLARWVGRKGGARNLPDSGRPGAAVVSVDPRSTLASRIDGRGGSGLGVDPVYARLDPVERGAGREGGRLYGPLHPFTIVTPQLLAATILGLAVKSLFAGAAIWALALGGVLFLIAALSSLAVSDPAAAGAPD